MRPASPGPVTLAVVPSTPVFSYQQLPVFWAKSSPHQKSFPFGLIDPPVSPECALPNLPTACANLNPSGATPIVLWWKRLPHDVENPLSGAPGHETPGKMSPSAPPPLTAASGIANIETPSRQL